jgi:hypothetical protein
MIERVQIVQLRRRGALVAVPSIRGERRQYLLLLCRHINQQRMTARQIIESSQKTRVASGGGIGEDNQATGGEQVLEKETCIW